MTETCRLEGGRSQVEPPRGQAGGDSVHKEAVLVLPIVGILGKGCSSAGKPSTGPAELQMPELEVTTQLHVSQDVPLVSLIVILH